MNDNIDFRAKCLAEKPEKCDVCGRTESITVHHKDGDRSNNELDNLIPLCGSCHQIVHNRPEPGRDAIRELQAALPDPQAVPVECRNCGHAWEYGGTLDVATCATCGGNVPVPEVGP